MRSAPTTSASSATDPSAPSVPAPHPETALGGTGRVDIFFYQAWELSEVPRISEVGQSDIRGKNYISEEEKIKKTGFFC